MCTVTAEMIGFAAEKMDRYYSNGARTTKQQKQGSPLLRVNNDDIVLVVPADTVVHIVLKLAAVGQSLLAGVYKDQQLRGRLFDICMF